MKNIKYVIFTLLFLLLNVFCVHASCTNEEIADLREDAKNIRITYKHLGKVELEEGEVYYNYFKLSAINLLDDFYVLLSKNTNELVPIDGKIETTVYSGTWDFHVYSNKCDEKISTIEVFIPTFNMYSLDPLCEGIDGDDFELCGKYYEYYVGYDDFVQRVTRYRDIHNIDDSSVEGDNLIDKIIVNVLEFVNKYKIYVFIGLIVVILFLIIIMILKKKKKRGVLE